MVAFKGIPHPFWRIVMASRFRAILLALTFTMASSLALAGTYQVDLDHTNIGFRVKHLMVSKVRGQFGKFQGSFDYDEKTHILGQIQTVIQVDSVNTDNEKRDNHLKSPDFFDAQNHPKMTFTSEKVNRSGADYEVIGTLSLKGVSKKITLKGELTGVGKGFKGEKRAGFEARGMINRKEFGLEWNKTLETGAVVVGDDVELILEVEGIEQ